MSRLIKWFFLIFCISSRVFADSNIASLEGNLPENLLSIILTVTAISVIPIFLIVATSFTRIVIVFSFLRSAIGLQQTPPNSVIIALSIFLTIFVMKPTFEIAYKNSIMPILAKDETISIEILEKALLPFNDFMLNNTKKEDIEIFLDIAKIKSEENPPFTIVASAFIVGELKKAFEIGFLIFLPFIVIDLLVASILMSMGMMMLPPVVISMPFKIVFFVLIDGWTVISVSLVKGFII